jgi:parvulin-like peptidyl-prolyl isomerase
MPQPFKAKIRSLLWLALCLGLTGCAGNTSSQSNANTAELPAVVATVNDRPLSTRLYEMYLKNGREELGLDPKTEAGRIKLDQLREGIVSEMIDRTLIAEEAERRGLIIPAGKMAEAETRTVQQFGGDQKYDEYLAAHHLTRDEYREQVVKLELGGELMRSELTKGVEVTDAEIKTYYDAHRVDADMQLPERVTASHILVAARPNLIGQEVEREKKLAGDALARAVRLEMERRRARAEELRRKASAGADFAALARESSDDPSSRESGGDLGTFTRNSHPRAFDDAAFALKPGAVSNVVQTDFGFHIIKVSTHEQARPMTLEESAQDIRKRLIAQREAARLTEWLRETRRRATIRITEPFRFGKLRDEFPAM